MCITQNKLNTYIKENYYDSKEDLYLAFIERCNMFCKLNRFQAMITQHSWMFLSRSEKIRSKVLNNIIINMAHLGARAFEDIGGEVVQTTSFVILNRLCRGYIGRYKRLVDQNSQQAKEKFYLQNIYYDFLQDDYSKIPGKPIVYWISKNFIKNFAAPPIGSVMESRVGLDTGNNDKYLRIWFECNINKIEFNADSVEQLHKKRGKKYVPHTKGGEYRKWYGNLEYVIAFDMINYNELLESGNHLPSRQYYFKEGMNWTRVSSKFALRYNPKGMVFNSACPTVFTDSNKKLYVLALLNSCVSKDYLDLLSPTINFQAGDVNKIPFVIQDKMLEKIDIITRNTIEISRNDWDSFETSWDFKQHPLISVGRVRTDYLHKAQKYVETAMQSAQYTIDNATSASEKSKATKAVTKYTKQLAEMKIYDEAIAHVANQRIEIDLDDGVKVNYAKFQGVEVAQEGKKALKVDLLAKI